MPFYLWSTTAASNATSDPTINWAEGMSPSSVNDSARAMEARLREWGNDISGSIVTAGSGTAYTVATGQGFDTLAHLGGQMVAFVPHTTNGATVTLNVDGTGAKPLRYGPGLELQSGMLIQGTPYVATYNNNDGAFYLQGFSANPYGIPLGGLLPYVGAAAPNSAFALPYGQAISRTAYAGLFSLVGTTFGTGDGSTTFNIPDLRGRAVFGLDNMGGNAASRITSSGSGIIGTTLGATGGAESHVLTTAEIPTGLHTLNFNDPGHSHTLSVGNTSSNGPIGMGGANFTSDNTGAILSNTTGITASLTDHAGGGAHAQMPPTIVLPFILRVI